MIATRDLRWNIYPTLQTKQAIHWMACLVCRKPVNSLLYGGVKIRLVLCQVPNHG